MNTLAALGSVPMASGDELHVPGLADFFPPVILFAGTPFELNRVMLIRILAAAVLCTLFLLAVRKPKLVPSRGQSVAEMSVGFVRTGIAEEVLGKEFGRKYAPLLTILFLAVFSLNITGIIPGLNLAGTSVMGLPLVMALTSYAAFIGAGIKAKGVAGYFKGELFPSGLPKALYVIVTPIEFLSTFVLRPATLAIRLLVNMMSGHFILALCFGATHFLFFSAAGPLKAVGVLTLGASFVMFLFEVFIAGLQAYIFTVLTAAYISLAKETH